MKYYAASSFTFFEKVFAIYKFFTARCLDIRLWDLFYLRPFVSFVWISVHSIRIFFLLGKKVDLVVIFNKGRKESFAVSLQNRRSCVCIKHLTLVLPRNLLFHARRKMHITPVSLKSYSVHWFLNRPNFAFVSFQKIIFHLNKCLYHVCLYNCNPTTLVNTWGCSTGINIAVKLNIGLPRSRFI